MSVQPTEEQQEIVRNAVYGLDLRVQAFAGTGKTTTLGMVADALKGRVAYLAFNKAMADEAKKKMPSHVACNTVHSLAFRAMRPSPERFGKRLSAQYVAEKFGVDGFVLDKKSVLKPATVAGIAIDTVGRFCNSMSAEITEKHIPWMHKDIPQEVKSEIVSCAKNIWNEMSVPRSDFPITHDAYCKQWALSGAKIDADHILFDEAQDANPLFLDILEQQSARGAHVIWVGDSYQQLYDWRGAINALERVKVDETLYLTHSYRLPRGIAGVASEVLRCLGEHRAISGVGSGDARDGSRAVLTRTNAGAVIEAIDLLQAGEKVRMRGASEIVTKLASIESVAKGRPWGEFALFGSLKELKEYAEEHDKSDIKMLIGLQEKYGSVHLKSLLEGCSATRSKSAVTVTTVHKAKGLEWDFVRLSDDLNLNPRNSGDADESDLRVLYVAMTRARSGLDYSEIENTLSMLGVDVRGHQPQPSRRKQLLEIGM